MTGPYLNEQGLYVRGDLDIELYRAYSRMRAFVAKKRDIKFERAFILNYRDS